MGDPELQKSLDTQNVSATADFVFRDMASIINRQDRDNLETFDVDKLVGVVRRLKKTGDVQVSDVIAFSRFMNGVFLLNSEGLDYKDNLIGRGFNSEVVDELFETYSLKKTLPSEAITEEALAQDAQRPKFEYRQLEERLYKRIVDREKRKLAEADRDDFEKNLKASGSSGFVNETRLLGEYMKKKKVDFDDSVDPDPNKKKEVAKSAAEVKVEASAEARPLSLVEIYTEIKKSKDITPLIDLVRRLKTGDITSDDLYQLFESLMNEELEPEKTKKRVEDMVNLLGFDRNLLEGVLLEQRVHAARPFFLNKIVYDGVYEILVKNNLEILSRKHPDLLNEAREKVGKFTDPLLKKTALDMFMDTKGIARSDLLAKGKSELDTTLESVQETRQNKPDFKFQDGDVVYTAMKLEGREINKAEPKLQILLLRYYQLHQNGVDLNNPIYLRLEGWLREQGVDTAEIRSRVRK